jgi:hypothetical protein
MKTLWTDEETFKRNGIVNRQNLLLECRTAKLRDRRRAWYSRIDSLGRQSTLIPEAEQHHDTQSVVLQLDGGSPHFEGNVRTFHDDNLPMWRVTFWFSVWGIIKDKVHNRNPAHVLQMKEQIRVEFSNLSDDLKRLCRNLGSSAYVIWNPHQICWPKFWTA